MKPVIAEGLVKPAEVDFNVAYSGGKLLLPDWEQPVVFDLESTEVRHDMPILLYHDPIKRVGNVSEATVYPDHIEIKGIIIKALPDAQTVLNVHNGGGSWECSVGTGPVPTENIELVTTGSKYINKQNITAPFYLLRGVTIREISLVAAGADSATEVQIRASLFNIKEKTMEEKFFEWVNSLGIDWETLDEKNRDNLRAAFDLKMEEEMKEAAEVEAEGCDAPVEEEKVEAEGTEAPVEEEEKKEPEVKANGLRAAKKRAKALRSVCASSMGRSSRPTEQRIIEASLLINAGAKDVAVEKAGYSQAEINEAVGRNYRNAGLHTIMRNAVKASGLYLPADVSGHELVRTFHEVQASGLSSRDYSPSGILSNVADKLLRIQADQINTVAGDVFYTRSVKNFNTVTSGKLTSLGAIPEVEAGAEFPNVGLADDSQTYKITKRGVNLTITIEDQVNDDIGAFERALSQFGRLFANTVDEVAVGSLMAQASTLFTTTNKKKATLAFSADNLKTVTGLFGRIKDAGGNYRNLVPGAILTGPETAIAARSIFVFNDKASIAPQNSTEVFQTPYNVYGTPYIASDKGWFLLPRDEKIGEVAYLNGNAAPSVERAALNTKNLNIEFLIWGTVGTLIYADAPAIYSLPPA